MIRTQYKLPEETASYPQSTQDRVSFVSRDDTTSIVTRVKEVGSSTLSQLHSFISSFSLLAYSVIYCTSTCIGIAKYLAFLITTSTPSKNPQLEPQQKEQPTPPSAASSHVVRNKKAKDTPRTVKNSEPECAKTPETPSSEDKKDFKHHRHIYIALVIISCLLCVFAKIKPLARFVINKMAEPGIRKAKTAWRNYKETQYKKRS